MSRYLSILSLLLFLVQLAPTAARTVYRKVEADGSVIFSDNPTPGSEPIELQELPEPPPPRAQPFPSVSGAPASKPSAARAPEYQSIAITSPATGSAIRHNGGVVAVAVALQPELFPKHAMVLYLNGQEQARGGSGLQLQNVERGEHSVSVAVVDENGKTLLRSAAVPFTMLRYSALFKRNIPGLNPPSPAPGPFRPPRSR